ncbi:MAG: sn-glycerol-1-phosphate dehydrogenase [Treponemataceae bacterium]
MNNSNETIHDTLVNEYGRGVLARMPELCSRHFGKGPYIVISDERIWNSLSKYMEEFLSSEPSTTIFLLPASPEPYASDALVAEIRAVLSQSGAVPIAVGAGTINDVVKRASFELGRRYVCVPTAPSVDGFTAFGAAITVNGFKVTLECPAPLCVLADEDVIVSAPYELIAAGYGDLVAKLTGGADWILADAMGAEEIDREVWNMVQPAARSILGQADAVRSRDRTAIGLLYRSLVMTGLAMQRYRDSRPASGTEHLLSHTWEMSHLEKNGKFVSHGFKVAIGTLVTAALFEELFSVGTSADRALAARAFAPEKSLLESRLAFCATELAGDPFQKKAEAVIRAKTPKPELMASRAEKAREKWGRMRAGIRAQLPPYAEIRDRLYRAGCPVEPEEIGLSEQACRRAVLLASMIRSRYTFLDLASELGVLDHGVEGVFSGSYFSHYAR